MCLPLPGGQGALLAQRDVQFDPIHMVMVPAWVNQAITRST
jgi:hypothetical protein